MIALARVLSALLVLSGPAVADHCPDFERLLAEADALDRDGSAALETRRPADACRLMGQANEARRTMLETTDATCFHAGSSKVRIKMNLGSTEAAMKAFCR